MKRLQGVQLLGTGSSLPARIFRNDEFPTSLKTSDEWIKTRTGILERRFCSAEETTTSLGIEAAQKALAASRLKPADIGMIICATLTPDMLVPSAACLIQAGLGCIGSAAFDLNAACSSFVYALAVAEQFIQTGAYKNVLVVGSDTLSRVVDFSDRNTCVLFGDGAGAVVLGASKDAESDDCWFRLRADGSQHEWIKLGGSTLRDPMTSAPQPVKRDYFDYLRMNGREVFKFAVSKIINLIREALSENQLTIDDIVLIVPHQVNQRILNYACEHLGFASSKIMMNLDRYGNTSSGSVPIALDEAIRSGRLNKGDRALLLAFGGGLTWSSALLRI